MDDMDRILRDLPRDLVPEGLSASVRIAVRRRHRRVLRIRRALASLLAALGLWLLWPALAWVSPSELLAPGTPWLMGAVESLGSESLDLLVRLWTNALSMQGAIGSSLAVSILLGALFVCCSIFLAIDRASWQPAPGQRPMARANAMSPSRFHL